MAAKKKALFVGLTSLDIMNICEHFPGEDEDAKATSQYWQKGGNAANSAEVMSQLGEIGVSLLSSFSNNFEGTFAKDHLTAKEVNVSNCVFHDNVGFPTSCCILSQRTGSRTIVHCRNGLPELTFEDFKSRIHLEQYQWVHFEGRGFPHVENMLRLAADFRNSSKAIKISVEMEKPKYLELMSVDFLKLPDVAFISKDVATHLKYQSAKETVMNIKKDMNLPANLTVVCPWGENGADAIDKTGNHWHSDAFKPEKVKDTLGAGDTFIAGVLHSLITGQSLEVAIAQGCRLAGRKCGQIGYDGLCFCVTNR